MFAGEAGCVAESFNWKLEGWSNGKVYYNVTWGVSVNFQNSCKMHATSSWKFI